MAEIYFRYSWDIYLVYIYLKYNWDLLEICRRYAWYMTEINLRYAWYIAEIYQRYSWDVPYICPRYVSHMVEIYLRNAGHIPLSQIIRIEKFEKMWLSDRLSNNNNNNLFPLQLKTADTEKYIRSLGPPGNVCFHFVLMSWILPSSA